MSTFGLLHGGGLEAWCWERLVPELEARGHQATTVDLPLDDPSAGAARLAELVLDTFAGLEELVLVGHSMSGLIIPVVASRRPVQRLVFLHAVLPRPGSSLADQVAAEPDMFNPEMRTVPPSWWSDEAIVTRLLFHDCTPEVAHAAFGRLWPPEGGVLVTEVTPLQVWPDVSCPTSSATMTGRPRRPGHAVPHASGWGSSPARSPAVTARCSPILVSSWTSSGDEGARGQESPPSVRVAAVNECTGRAPARR